MNSAPVIPPFSPAPAMPMLGSLAASTVHGQRDRRQSTSGDASRASSERRQFGNSHSGLSDAGRELAAAIDAYKLDHHRRYITCDEMLVVLRALGYSQN